ncbi:MAG TPA: hypothetical protein P5527_02890, partial [Kiritimatiellia bacterium]|nr:hypothetical protein [Kiritimatiellia bacterium]
NRHTIDLLPRTLSHHFPFILGLEVYHPAGERSTSLIATTQWFAILRVKALLGFSPRSDGRDERLLVFCSILSSIAQVWQMDPVRRQAVFRATPLFEHECGGRTARKSGAATRAQRGSCHRIPKGALENNVKAPKGRFHPSSGQARAQPWVATPTVAWPEGPPQRNDRQRI